MPKYAQIMQFLNPKIIIQKTQIPNDTARSKYTLQSSIVGSYHEFEEILVDYVSHHMRETVGHALPPDMSLDKAKRFLDTAIGYDNAVFQSLSGTDGGIVNIINVLCECFTQEAKQAYYQYWLNKYVDPLNFQEVTELCREIKGKLSAYSPQAFQYIEPEQMAAQYREILWNYIESLTKYKNLWQY